MYINVATGTDARVSGVDAISGNDLGVRFSGFRDLGRFTEQTQGMNIGHISWPGGALAEASPDRFGLNFDGLFNPALGQPGLAEMMAYANETGSSLSVVLPTARYANDLDQLRADMRDFMGDLLGGDYGPLPDGMFLHIGSEHYAHFQGLTPDGAAAGYGRVAAAMVDEIRVALNDPNVNIVGAEIDVAVQAGRSLPEDQLIRDSFTEEQLADVDMVTHHRYAAQADGIDAMLRQFRPINEAWQADVTAAGGDEPQINLGEWNVASMTRSEALTRYIRDMGAQGQTVHRADIDLDGRTDTHFENYYQNLLDTRDYGAAQPQLYLEMFSEYAAEGLGAASIHAADLMHAGRMTFADVEGNPVRFVGAELIDMLYESVEGTTVLQISEANRANSPIATYGFESDDRLVLFVAADENAVLGDVTLNIEGLNGGYTAIWTDSLTSEVPQDWMERFGVTDNPDVDESNEGDTYTVGLRGEVESSVQGNHLSFTMTEPGQVVRVVVARTPEEAARIAEWAGEPDYGSVDDTTAVIDPPPVVTPPPGPVTQPPVTGGTDDDDTDEETVPETPPATGPETTPQQPSWAQWLFPSLGGVHSAAASSVTAAPVVSSVPNAHPETISPASTVSAFSPNSPPAADLGSEHVHHAPGTTMSFGRSISDWLASFRHMPSDSPSETMGQSMRAEPGISQNPRAQMAERQDSADIPLADLDETEPQDDTDTDDKGLGVMGELTSVMSALSGIAMGGMLMAMSKGVF